LANQPVETVVFDHLFATVAQTPAVQSLLRRLEEGRAFSCAGVSAGGQAFLAALLRHLFPQRPIVVVTEGVKAQESFQQDIETWLRFGAMEDLRVAGALDGANADESAVTRHFSPLFYPAWEILPHEAKLPHVDVISERLETLVALSAARNPEPGTRNPEPIIVTSVVALLQRTFAPETLREQTRNFRRGDRIDPLALAQWLEEHGYEPEAQVNHKGEMALRGGILDLFPLTSAWPVRLEFFGDELDSLRYFDPITQISRETIGEVTVPPGGELGILKKRSEVEDPKSKTQSLCTLLDYLPAETIFLLCEPAAIGQQAQNYAEVIPREDTFFLSWDEFQTQLQTKRLSLVAVSELSPEATVDSSLMGINLGDTAEVLDLPLASLDAFRPIVERAPEPQVAEAQRRDFFAQLHRWLRQGYVVRVFCNNEGERQRFGEIWAEEGFTEGNSKTKVQTPKPGDHGAWALEPGLWNHLGALTRGFLYEPGTLAVVTDAEIFGRYKVQRPRRLKSPHAQTSRSLLEIDFADLEEGDYVVHLQHGIGRYVGLQLLPVSAGLKPLEKAATTSGAAQECLVIEYAPSDPEQPPPKLYVPVSEAHLVSKYVGTGKARPPLSTLGGGRWAKAKEQAERAVRDLASELLSIQAARESQAGHGFAPDAPWQREFESAFLYEETPDQMRAIVETKADMEEAKPMDRLICGDVGYGKTEVAIRAAFKAIMGGKQVAVLVPTTVLAQQHFNTFRERMADYPIRIELLSRFRTSRQQKHVIEELAAGSVDIVIGTHRLVQKDIAFKDLGLVVIDEEQRFGVLHKEKFKLLRQLVDVLTLSATPIPRTLYLALTGARDMSTIETPPQDRLPVETIVTQYDERTIRDAIQRELNREGQVFYLHNRVFDIEAVATRLRQLLPKARIVVGHGQMHSDDLEEVMTRFVNGEADVLLSTTIIESGLDIPNANTIIIDRADRFGLSDLYQLRGRVGRYKHQAYAYLLLPRHAGLLADARKRISAIKQYSTLGSGFKIAMRDLEIRGAGNLLGPQQSGHITAVGFELYCQLLKQSISALKGEKVKPRIEVEVRLDFLALNPGEEVRSPKSRGQRSQVSRLNVTVPRETASYTESEEDGQSAELDSPSSIARSYAFIPLNYISDSRQRIETYRKLSETMDAGSLDHLRTELRDRFGPLPPPLQLLLQVAALKILASEKRVTAIETKGDRLMLTRNNDYITVAGKFPRLKRKQTKGRLGEIQRLLEELR
jgi:transcription-repair coupling factor (superfamily II helicase)